MRPDAQRSSRKRELAADVLLLTIVWWAMVLLVRPTGDFPINDDWVYAKAVQTLLETGRFEISSYSSANVGPQVYWGALFAKAFGFSFGALRASTLVLGWVGGIGAYLLFREMWPSRVGALVFALATIVNPIYFGLANTFMTDVPFMAVLLLSMLAIIAGLQRDRSVLIAVGLGLALVAMLMRQFAAVVLVGFALGWIVRRGVRPRTILVALGPLVAGLVIHGAFTLWLSETGRKPLPPSVPTLLIDLTPGLLWTVKTSLFSVVSYLGLLLAPLAVLFVPRPSVLRADNGNRATWIGIVGVGVVIGAGYVVQKQFVPVGENVLTWFGLGPLTNSDTFILGRNLPHRSVANSQAWTAVTGVTIVASAIVVVALAFGARRLIATFTDREPESARRSAVAVFLIGAGASYVALLMVVATGFALFDRYMLLLAVMAGLSIPVLRRSPTTGARPARGRVLLSGLFLAVSAAFSVVATHDYLAWSEVRWSALQNLVARGVSPERIDGGYEFNGWTLYDPGYRAVRGKSWWWVHDDEYRISSGPLDGYAESIRLPVARWWDSGVGDLYLLHR